MACNLYLTPIGIATRQRIAEMIALTRQTNPLAEVRLLLTTSEAVRDLRQTADSLALARLWQARAALEEVPALTGPLPAGEGQGILPVTGLARFAMHRGVAWPDIRPTVYRGSVDTRPARAPDYMVGRLLHHQLSDWNSLKLPDREPGR